MSKKTYARADLVRFFVETKEAARKVGIIRDATELFEGDEVHEQHVLYATVEAFWCEEYRFGVLFLGVECDALDAFPKDHFFRRLPETRLYTDYLEDGDPERLGKLTRWATEAMDEWIETVNNFVPIDPFDHRVAPDEDHGATGVTIDDMMSNV